MPFNGSGTYTPPGADFPAVSGTIISSTKYNNVQNDVATGLSNAVTRDGQSAWLANLPAGGFKLTGLGTPSAANDALTWGNFASVKTIVVTDSTVPANGLYLPGTNRLGLATNTVKRGEIDANGNMVLGTGTPQAWSTTLFKHLAIGDSALAGVAGRRDASDQLWLTSNLYFDGTGAFKAIQNGAAAYLQIIAGGLSFAGNSTVTAGSTITLASRWAVAAGGNFSISAPDSGAALSITGIVGQNVITLSDGTSLFNVFLNGASGTTLNQASNHPIDIRTNGIGRLNIGASGNFVWNSTLSSAFTYQFEGGDSTLINWKNNSRAADNRVWMWQLTAAGNLSLVAENDALNAGTVAIDLSRSGTTVSAMALKATTINFGPAGTDWQVDSSGRLKNVGVAQPLVHATRVTTQVAGTTVIWPTASVNRGTALNLGTGVFTAPVAGSYMFLGTQTIGNTSGASGARVFTLTGSAKGIFWQKRRQTNTGTPDDVDTCIIVDLVGGETVSLTVDIPFAANLLLEANNCWMSVYFLG